MRYLPGVGLLPEWAVRLEWDVRDDAGPSLPAGTYVVVARALADDRRVTASTAFDVRR